MPRAEGPCFERALHSECDRECCFGVLYCLGASPEACGACFLLAEDARTGLYEGVRSWQMMWHARGVTVAPTGSSSP